MLITIALSLLLNAALIYRVVSTHDFTRPSPDDPWQVVTALRGDPRWPSLDVYPRFVATDGTTEFVYGSIRSSAAEAKAKGKARTMNRRDRKGGSLQTIEEFKQGLREKEQARQDAIREMEQAARQFDAEMAR